MRALFYVGEQQWSGRARLPVRRPRPRQARTQTGHLACCDNSRLARLSRHAGVDTVTIDRSVTAAGTTWDLRKLLQDRAIEVAFVFTERDQLIVSSAMRLAERGAVIRRVPSFEHVDLQNSGRLAVRILRLWRAVQH